MSSPTAGDPQAQRKDPLDPRAVEAARKGQLPPPAEGNAGESAPGEPSRAEVLYLRPDLADNVSGAEADDHVPTPGELKREREEGEKH